MAVLLHQCPTGIDDGRFTVELAHGALVTTLTGAEIEKGVAALLVDNRDIYRPALYRKHLKHFFNVVTVHGLNGADSIIRRQLPRLPVGQVCPSGAQCLQHYPPGVAAIGKMIGEGLRGLSQQTVAPADDGRAA